METKTAINILLITLDKELPSWLKDTTFLKSHHWTAYLKPVPEGLISLSLPEGLEKEGITVVDIGDEKTRRAHSGKRSLPRWFENNFLWQSRQPDRVQRFPFVLLYDLEEDPNLPFQLRDDGIDYFFELPREQQYWKTNNDLSDIIKHAWLQWQSPEWAENNRLLAIHTSSQKVIAVITSADKQDQKCWYEVNSNIGKDLKKRGYDFDGVRCDDTGTSTGSRSAKETLERSEIVVLLISNYLLNTSLWEKIVWPQIQRKIRQRGAAERILWFVTQEMDTKRIPKELKSCKLAWRPSSATVGDIVIKNIQLAPPPTGQKFKKAMVDVAREIRKICQI